MSITREQVADLQPGDIVEYHAHDWPEGHTVTGALYEPQEAQWIGALWIAGQLVRFPDGDTTAGDYRDGTLTVVSRAPRPLYVNHRRAEPVEGDIVRDCDGDAWRFERDEWWCASVDACNDDDPDGYPIDDYRPLTLLWDGQTGMAVPS